MIDTEINNKKLGGDFMPCIQLSTNQILSSDKQTILKKNFGKAIEIIPGKSEKWLMCKFQSACDMWFQGEQKYVEIGRAHV